MRSRSLFLVILVLGLGLGPALAHNGESPPPEGPPRVGLGDPRPPTPGITGRPGRRMGRASRPPTSPVSRPGAVTGGGGVHQWAVWWAWNRERLLGLAELRRSRIEGAGSPATPGVDAVPEAKGAHRAAALAALRTATGDRDEHIATSAIISLGKGADAGSVALLLGLASDGERARSIRESAFLALGMIGGREATKMLASRLLDVRGPWRERAHAAAGLGLAQDPGAIPALWRGAGARGGRRDVPGLSLLALGLLRDDIVAPDLLRMVKPPAAGGEPDDIVRALAVAALGKLGSRAAVPALLAALGDDSPAVRRQAALSVGALARPDDESTVRRLLRQLATDRDTPSRSYAALTLAEIGVPAAADALLGAYRGGDQTLGDHAALALGLLARGLDDASRKDRIAAFILKELGRSRRVGRRGALTVALGLAGEKKAVPALLALLEDGNAGLRTHAALALGILGAPEAVPLLRRILKERGDHVLQREAALALALLGDRETEGLLTDQVEKGRSGYVRGAAAMALAQLVPPARADPLTRLLVNAREMAAVRNLAAVALGIVLDGREPPHIARLSSFLAPVSEIEVLGEILSIY